MLFSLGVVVILDLELIFDFCVFFDDILELRTVIFWVGSLSWGRTESRQVSRAMRLVIRVVSLSNVRNASSTNSSVLFCAWEWASKFSFSRTVFVTLSRSGRQFLQCVCVCVCVVLCCVVFVLC